MPNWSFDTDCGVCADRALPSVAFKGVTSRSRYCLFDDEVGVLPSLKFSSSSPLLGVSMNFAWVSSVFLDGVAATLLSKNAKSPNTFPSLCGVGPMDVGAIGLGAVLSRDGVLATGGMSSFWRVSVGLEYFDRLTGVWTGAGAVFRLVEVESSLIFPERISRSLLYSLYFLAKARC